MFFLLPFIPRDIEILGCCPAGSLALAGHPFSDDITIKNTLWGRCFITSTSLAPYLFLLGWLKLNLILSLDQLRLALGDWIIAILLKGCKPDDFEPHNSLKLSFTNIWGLRSSFVECESFLESNSPDIHALCDNLGWLN